MGKARNVVGFVLAAAVVGALTGLAAASFRVLLDHATLWRASLSHWSPPAVGGVPSSSS